MTSQSLSQGLRGLRRTVAPTLRAVDLNSFKVHAGYEDDDQDTLISEYIDAATDYAEEYQNRCWRLSTWQATYDSFPCDGVFYLPRPPLVAVSSIAYRDTAGDSQTFSASYYVVDAISEPGRIGLAIGYSWPPIGEMLNAVTVTYTAGYSTVADIPARTRQAIRMLASHWFEQREPIVIGTIVANVPLSVVDLLDADRLISYR